MMVGDNIKKYRRENGYSQEELAAMLHVVRQTLSKWENSRSVPDAELLIRISEVLHVPVSTLLGVTQEEQPADLSAELARVNEELAERNRQLQRAALANKKRGLILFLSFAALFVTITVRDPLISLTAFGLCLVAALLVLFRNLSLLSERSLSAAQMKALKAATIFNAVFLALLIVFCGLLQVGVIVLTDRQESYLLMGMCSCVFLFFGALCPRLPFQRHTGLRLPWTVQDEETWVLAHKIIGLISLPITLLYLAAALAFLEDTESVGIVSAIAMGVYIGIPALISLIFFWKKYHSL